MNQRTCGVGGGGGIVCVCVCVCVFSLLVEYIFINILP